jgi:hypothetical protein
MTVELSSAQVIANGADTVTITTELEYTDGTPVKGASVYFELNDPKFTKMFGTWGRAHVRKTTGSTGIVSTTFTPPDILEFRNFEQEYFPYDIPVTVIATKHSGLDDWSITEDSLSIELLSPKPVVENITISPNPAKAFIDHTVVIDISDIDQSAPYKYSVEVVYGNLSFVNSSEQSKKLEFSTDQETVILKWMAPKRGINLDELILATEMENNLQSLAIDVSASGAKSTLKKTSEYLTQQGAKKILRKTVGVFIPIIDKGKTVYGMWGSTKELGIAGVDAYNAKSTKEMLWRFADMGVSGIKLTLGAINLYTGSAPVVGKFSDIVADSINALLGTAQSYMRLYAEQERVLHAQELELSMIITVDVEDSNGYAGSEYLIYPMEYVGFN